VERLVGWRIRLDDAPEAVGRALLGQTDED